MAVCSCSYLAQSRTKSYYLYVKNTTLALGSKEEAGILVNISCLTQRKQKHLPQFQANAPVSLHGMVASSPPFSRENHTHKVGHKNKKYIKT